MVEQINTEELKSYEHGDAVFEARPLTIEEARSMQRPSSKLFCRLRDNEHITFGHYSIRDYDSGTVLLDIGEEMQDYAHLNAVAEENEGRTSLQSRTIKYPFGPQFLELKNLALKLEFNVVGEEPVGTGAENLLAQGSLRRLGDVDFNATVFGAQLRVVVVRNRFP